MDIAKPHHVCLFTPIIKHFLTSFSQRSIFSVNVTKSMYITNGCLTDLLP